jgi:phosphate acetyltransferase
MCADKLPLGPRNLWPRIWAVQHNLLAFCQCEGRDRETGDRRAATKLAQSKGPDLLIDGPLQYDAAFMPDVAKIKAPNSPVAGRATVFSANVLSVGPMLQGLRRPVNDLSRGASVDDIVYTVALTAIQATQV